MLQIIMHWYKIVLSMLCSDFLCNLFTYTGKPGIFLMRVHVLFDFINANSLCLLCDSHTTIQLPVSYIYLLLLIFVLSQVSCNEQFWDYNYNYRRRRRCCCCCCLLLSLFLIFCCYCYCCCCCCCIDE